MRWYFPFQPRATAEERRAKAKKPGAKLDVGGGALQPVPAMGRSQKIVQTFWGRAWCAHLESFSDYSNRLPRGRSYLREGMVLHLAIEPGMVTACVQGSRLYKQTIAIKPLGQAAWERLKAKCKGQIGSLIELLQGRISEEIMAEVCNRETGLFPHPKEIKFACSCPDWAWMCKHVAAVFYGVGTRLDATPDLLFRLRGIDSEELSSLIDSSLPRLLEPARQPGVARGLRLNADAVAEIFGQEFEGDLSVQPATSAAAAVAPRPAPRPKAQTAQAAPARARSGGTGRGASGEITGDQVWKVRQRLDLTQAQFAARLGVSTGSVARWESCRGPLRVQPKMLRRLQKEVRVWGQKDC